MVRPDRRVDVDRALSALRRRKRRLSRQAHVRLLAVGDRVRCPVCGWSGQRFESSTKPRRPNRICPSCGSSERYRALAIALNRRGPVPPGTRLLEVAPIHTVEPLAVQLGYTYTSLDLSSPRARVLGDLTALPFGEASFDLVVCFHVLEHVPDDRAAVRELVRITAPDGEVLVVVPRDDARPDTFEVEGADPADYERLYGQSDHVRIYGADLLDRWRGAGVDVTEDLWTDRFTPDLHRHAALSGDDDRFWHLDRPHGA
ncbi:methyltransferase domain-containing protein [Aquihabitans sp. G128]|uniref:class I SAM-dependent methyltransferase n=1 Tax=Aquihabitans sp. G128 TaxID=2849779 RepID=UPI001C23C291|nr:class I SAM-dependent methyltransferase [Aquihabitans sp. G128]QXC60269.1 methyltransferase domain-containing protein [Aquihabitans sp. G128]